MKDVTVPCYQTCLCNRLTIAWVVNSYLVRTHTAAVYGFRVPVNEGSRLESSLRQKIRQHKPRRFHWAMSATSKVVLALSVTFTGSIIYYVHYSQKRDRERLHDGVLRDMERQTRKIHNVKMLQEQIKLTKSLKEQRDSSDSAAS